MGWFKIGSDLRQLTKLLNKKVCGWVYNVNQNFSRLVLRFSTWVCTIFMCHGMYVAKYLRVRATGGTCSWWVFKEIFVDVVEITTINRRNGKF